MDRRTTLYLGALLHDIGKFAWRAQSLRAGEDHEKLGEYFIREHLGPVACCRDSIDALITASQREVPAILRADTTTAAEREQQASKESRRLLLSAFQRVNIGKAEQPTGAFYVEPKPLATEVTFPRHLDIDPAGWVPNDQSMINDHQGAWKNFVQEIGKLRSITDDTAFCDTLYTLLEKYTANVSSASYQTLPDISLFDHSRVTAATTLCMLEKDASQECLLIRGDISGIQRFIYANLGKAERKAKMLRGRSFFVTLLSETVVAYLVRELQLFRSNVLYNSGGHFLLVAPNNKRVLSALEEAERNINLYLTRRTVHQLHLVLAWHQVDAKSLFEQFEEVQKQIDHKLQMAKRKKSFSVLGDLVLGRNGTANGASLDSVLERLGEELPNSHVLIEVHSGTSPLSKDWSAAFEELGIYWKLVSSDSVEKTLSNLQGQPIKLVVVHDMKSTHISPFTNLLSKFSFPVALRYFFVGQHAPPSQEAPGTLADFEELAKMGSEKYPLLGFARMDVDSLGAVMLLGLRERNEREKKFTVSRFARLSRELTHFFSSQINTLAKEHKIYLVYSGGDDLFAVGSWINLLNFVQEVRGQFSQFTCQNGNITISCGIAFTKPGYPIHRVARLAAEQQELAKNMRGEKNAIALLDCPVSWEELENQLSMAKKILKVMGDTESTMEQTIPPSFIHKLLAATQSVIERNRGSIRLKGIANIARVLARLRYAFARRGVDAQFLATNRGTIQSELVRLLLETPEKERKYAWRNFRIAATYVIWSKRKKQ